MGRKDRRAGYVLLCAVAQGVGLLGLFVAPTHVTWCWAILLGIGSAGYPLALMLIELRSSSSQEADRISGFAQTVGYPLAAVGPLAVGPAHEVTGSWRPGIAALAAKGANQALAVARLGHPVSLIAAAGKTTTRISY